MCDAVTSARIFGCRPSSVVAVLALGTGSALLAASGLAAEDPAVHVDPSLVMGGGTLAGGGVAFVAWRLVSLLDRGLRLVEDVWQAWKAGQIKGPELTIRIRPEGQITIDPSPESDP